MKIVANIGDDYHQRWTRYLMTSGHGGQIFESNVRKLLQISVLAHGLP
jgi:hypothetical protein